MHKQRISFCFPFITVLYCFSLFSTEGTDGQVLMNERPRNLSKFRKLSAYIRQDNQLHGNLTVDEAMSVAAKLKVGDKSASDRETIVSSFAPYQSRNI